MMRPFCLLLVLAALATPARAEEDDAARADRWRELSQAVFGTRPLADGAGIVALDAPARAQDAALVPVGVTTTDAAGSRIKTVYLLVDGNPSPLAGTFHFGPLGDAHMLRTRLRVDQYTLLHAVAETEDGRLFVAERFIKAAGGCSAPSLKDPAQAQALARLGQMRLRVDEATPVVPGRPAVANLLISHPNNNGMQVDQLTHNFVPARFIQDVTVRYGGELVFSLDADISLSEDPAITFGFVPRGPGALRIDMQDSTRAVFAHDFPVPASGS